MVYLPEWDAGIKRSYKGYGCCPSQPQINCKLARDCPYKGDLRACKDAANNDTWGQRKRESNPVCPGDSTVKGCFYVDYCAYNGDREACKAAVANNTWQHLPKT